MAPKQTHTSVQEIPSATDYGVDVTVGGAFTTDTQPVDGAAAMHEERLARRDALLGSLPPSRGARASYAAAALTRLEIATRRAERG